MKTIKKLALVLAFMTSNLVAAQTLIYYFGTPITNSIVPYGTGPWLTVQLVQIEDYTKLIMESDLSSGEFISKVGFNLNVPFDYDSLILNPVETFGTFNIPTFQSKGFTLGGDNEFDLVLQFDTARANRFDNGDVFSFVLNVPISNFDVVGETSSIVHIQGIGANSESTWLVPQIPEPSSVLLGGIGIILLLKRRRYA